MKGAVFLSFYEEGRREVEQYSDCVAAWGECDIWNKIKNSHSLMC